MRAVLGSTTAPIGEGRVAGLHADTVLTAGSWRIECERSYTGRRQGGAVIGTVGGCSSRLRFHIAG
eukprot:2796624-Alexandrium_andersonii.AAC.1